MAARSEEDDYWNASLTQQRAKAFNFEEEEIFGSQLCGVSKSGTAKLSKEAREGMDSDSTLFNIDSLTGSLSAASIAEFPQTSERPLQSLISEKALQCILEARTPQEKRPKNLNPEEEVRILRRKIQDRWVAPSVTTTVNKIMLGHPYSLELYRSLKSKTQLLDAAITLGDGNAILAVILFLTQTLKKSLVYQLLRDRPVAVSQYCSYLSTRYQLQELTDLLEMLGESREAAMKQFQLGVCGTVNLQRRLQKLKACLSNHFSSPDSKDRVFIENYIKLLEWQFTVAGSNAEIAKDLFGLSVLESLAYTCRHYWEEPRGSIYSPLMLSQQQGINERQFQWTVLTVRASMKAWDDIENLFITKSWLGGRKLKAAIPMDQVVMQLHSCGADSTILNKYLELIDNVDKRIALASKLQCHTVVVDVLVTKRDRRALENYKANLHPQSPEYFYAENALHVSTTKWKN